ncbi:MAG: 2OG-Fe(II) oxygenase family protein [Candidatus Sericytochromatia bacterium]
MSIINLGLDFEKIRNDFLSNDYKYITINNFLADDIAEILYNGFKGLDKSLWYQANLGNPKIYRKNLSTDSLSYQFSYKYEMFPLLNQNLLDMSNSGIRRQNMNMQISNNPETEISMENPLRKISYFLNSDEMHNLISYITNTQLSYKKLICFASKYTSDDFLSLHTDRPINILQSPREIAVILNMTKNWLIHWGGILIILDEEEKNIIEAINPKFNSLTLFKVPLKHAVLPVSCHCNSERFALTGWYHKY